MAATNGRVKARPYVCKVCQKAFLRNEHLQRHNMAHENKKPYSCKTCGSCYSRADVLRRHIYKCSEQRQQRQNVQDKPTQVRDGDDTITVDNCETLNQSEENSRVGNQGQWGLLQSQMESESRLQDSSNTLYAPPISPDSTHSSTRTSGYQQSFATNSMSEDQYSRTRQSRITPLATSLSSLDNQLTGQIVDLRVDFNQPLIGQSTIYDNNPIDTNSSHQLTTTSNLHNSEIHANVSSTIQNTSMRPFEPDFAFLEDVLLPGFNFMSTGISTPLRWLNDEHNAPQPLPVDQDDFTQLQNQNSQSSINERNTYSNTKTHFRPARITNDDLEKFKQSVQLADRSRLLCNFSFPSVSRFTRFLTAYIEYFDPHTPIIHLPTYSAAETPPALTLAMLAIGGLHVSEHKVAVTAYEAACILITQYELEQILDSTLSFELWPVQAALLCAQFGAFSNNKIFQCRAHHHISFASSMLRREQGKAKSLQLSSRLDWSEWRFLEIYSRVACWLCTLSGLILALDPTAACIVPSEAMYLPTPCDENLWYAKSSQEWLAKSGDMMMRQDDPGITCLAQAVFQGQAISTNVSSFGLLALIGFILSFICGRERLCLHAFEVEKEFIIKVENAISAWEILWRRHSRTDLNSNKSGEPLLADCFSLVGSAYFHLYLSQELYALKSRASNSEDLDPLPACKAQGPLLKAVKYAASSWLVRAKMGLAHLQRTAALQFGGHSLITAYEGALILSWWLKNNSEMVDGTISEDEDVNIVNELFRDIFEELEDQGIPCTGTARIHAPVEFYRRLMIPWIWRYSDFLQQGLQIFNSKLDMVSQFPS